MASRSPRAPFWPIYTPGPAWPNAEVSHPFYGRAWCTADFAHDPETIANVYAAISLRSTAPGEPLVPRAYHFAYRRSEEHTSELQSLMRISYAVFCLKKKNNYKHEPQSTFINKMQHSHQNN